MIRKSFVKAVLTILILIITWSAEAGVVTGGGGAAFVCRDDSRAIKSVELLDLFEARELSGESLIDDSGASLENQLKDALGRLRNLHGRFASSVEEALRYILAHKIDAGPDLVITPPGDVGNKYQKEGCSLEGMMYFDGTRQKLVIKPAIFNFQKTRDVAASYMHEAIYKVMRDTFDQTDSVLSRELNGCIFTADPIVCLGLKYYVASHGTWDCGQFDVNVYDQKNYVSVNVTLKSFQGSSYKIPVQNSFTAYDQGSENTDHQFCHDNPVDRTQRSHLCAITPPWNPVAHAYYVDGLTELTRTPLESVIGYTDGPDEGVLQLRMKPFAVYLKGKPLKCKKIP